MSNLVISDEQARKLIVTEVGKNFFVEASAGSGKTTSLVYRMVSMVEKGVPVEKICTITFTKAAADEFFSRFQSLLSIRSVKVPDKTDKFIGEKTDLAVERCQKALANIDACFMGTIDAFCNMIAHELPTQLGVPSDSEIITNEERAAAIKKEYETILKDNTHKLNKYALRFKDLFYPHYNCFVNAINTVSDNRNMDIVFDKQLVDVDMNVYLTPEINELLSILKMITEQDIYFGPGDTDRKRQKNHHTLKIIYKKLVAAKDLNDVVYLVADAIKTLNDTTGYPKDLDGSSLTTSGILELKPRARNLSYTEKTTAVLNSLLIKIENYKYSLCLYLAREATEDIAKSLKEQGKFQFFDYLYYTTNAFKNSCAGDKELVKHIMERHSHFLLDESQDTNPMQTEMFFYLTGTVQTDDWTKTEPKEGSLFIVGDPKQSIYAFRGANVQAYKKTKAIFEAKGEALVLTNNFRSNTDLKEWFNDSMDSLLNHDDDALEYSDIPVSSEEKDNFDKVPKEKGVDILDGVYKYTVNIGDDPEVVAKIIKDLVNNPKRKIICKKDDGFATREIGYEDFLLVPRNTDVKKLVTKLNEYQIPVMIEAKIPFEDAKSLEVLTNLVFLLKDTKDIPSFMEVVFGDLYALNDLDIIKMRNDGFNFDISDISEIKLSDSKHDAIVKELASLYEKTKDMSYSSTMLYILNDKDFDFLNRVNSSCLEYTYFVIEKTKEKEEAGLLSNVQEFKEFANHFYNQTQDEKENRVLKFRDDIKRVKVSNLHKVKGLQAPIVMLINPMDSIKETTSFVDYSVNPAKAYYSAIKIRNKHNAFVPMIKTDAFDNQKTRWELFAKAEQDRLQYVAATRAESVLFVSKCSELDKKHYDPWGNLTERINDADAYKIPEVFAPLPADPVDVSYEDTCVDTSCYEESNKYHSPSKMVMDIKYEPDHNNLDEIKEETEIDDATKVGTAVHRLMECIATSKNSRKDVDAFIKSIVKEYNVEHSEDILNNVYRQITSGGYPQKDSIVNQDILKMILTAKDVRCELPFSYKKHGVIVNGVIDLLYEDDSGYHIIDYKTNYEDDVSVLEKEYEKQLSDYVEALAEIGIKADAHIYHIKVK